jgi:ABC-type antimicrobial peptide transport system permease subunit
MHLLRNLMRQKTRTLLTLFGVTIGIAAVVMLGAVAQGLSTGYDALVGGKGQADLVVMQKDSYDLMLSVVDEAVADELRTMPEIRSVSSMVYAWVGSGEALYFGLFGFDPEEEAIQKYRLVEGEPPGRRNNEAMLGRVLSRNLDIGVGDTMVVTGKSFKIVGIYETGDSFSDTGMVTTLRAAQEVLGRVRQVSGLLLRLRRSDDEQSARDRITRRYTDLTVSRTSEFGNQTAMIQAYKALGWGIGLLAIVIGGITMTNTIIMSVHERTREIGVLRAIGWSRRRIMGMFLADSLFLALLGGLMGAGLGALLATLAGRSPAYGGILTGQVTPALIGQGFAVAIVMGLVGGAMPAWRAAQLTPLEALQYEGGIGGQSLSDNAIVRRLGGTLRSLLRRRTRTLLTIVGTTIGIATIVALQSIVDGLFATLDVTLGGTELVAAQAGVSDTSFSAVSDRDARRIANLPDVQFVEGSILSAVPVGGQGVLLVQGIHPLSITVRRFKIVEGDPLQSGRNAILGRKAAENMDKQVGDTVRIGSAAFRVAGIYETGQSFEDGGAVITLREAQRLFGKPRQYTWLYIKVREPARAAEIRDQIQADFPDLNIAISDEFFDNSTELQATNALMGLIIFLALLVGGLGMMNTMVMSVLERTAELGLLRAVGWRRRRVLWLILRESIALGLVGGLIGTLVGIILAVGISMVPAVGALIQPIFTVKGPGMGLALALTLGVAGGLYPAWRATRMRPVDALRYE